MSRHEKINSLIRRVEDEAHTYTASSQIKTLMRMLSYVRPEGSVGQSLFVQRWIIPLGAKADPKGNYWKRVGDHPRVMWSCHTDTVHSKRQAEAKATQKVRRSKKGIIYRADGKDVLGADDGAGCWLAREMILAKVPGLYIFHAGEEIGGVGSSYIAKHMKDNLTGIEMAIALDRADCTDVITHQGGQRCCSDKFADALADQLTMLTGYVYKPDSTGTFTDTANYVDIVPECTNLSIGYAAAHSHNENLDGEFLKVLCDALKVLDTAKLPVVRVAGTHESKWANDYLWESEYTNYGSRKTRTWSSTKGYDWRDDYGFDPDERYAKSTLSDYERMVQLISDNPDHVADWFEQSGFDAEMLENELRITKLGK